MGRPLNRIGFQSLSTWPRRFRGRAVFGDVCSGFERLTRSNSTPMRRSTRTKLPRLRKTLKAVETLSTITPRETIERICRLVGTTSDAAPPFAQMRALFCYGDPNSNGLESNDAKEIGASASARIDGMLLLSLSVDAFGWKSRREAFGKAYTMAGANAKAPSDDWPGPIPDSCWR